MNARISPILVGVAGEYFVAAEPPTKEATSSILEEPVSSSRLNTFHQCRRKFAFTYIEKLKKAVTAPLHVGRMVHMGLQTAEETLLLARELFPKEPLVHYNLACYAAQLGRIDDAKALLATALTLDPVFKEMALEDEDLAGVW